MTRTRNIFHEASVSEKHMVEIITSETDDINKRISHEVRRLNNPEAALRVLSSLSEGQKTVSDIKSDTPGYSTLRDELVPMSFVRVIKTVKRRHTTNLGKQDAIRLTYFGRLLLTRLKADAEINSTKQTTRTAAKKVVE